MDRSKLFIRLRKGEEHLDAVKRALERADGKLNEFLEEFEKSLAEAQS